MMIGLRVKEKDGMVVLKWMLSEVKIPKAHILEVVSDETYGGKDIQALRMGFPYATTERYLLKTTEQNYLLYTGDHHLKKRIEEMVKG